MSKQGTVGALARPTEDSEGTTGEIVEADRGNLKLANIDVGSMAIDLRDLFDRVMSGKPYEESQVRNATKITDTMVKVLRFEFDVYKHFTKDAPKHPGRPVSKITIAAVAEWLRKRGDKVEKGAGIGLWIINDRHCEEKDLIIRANNRRTDRGEKPFQIDVD